MNESAARWAYAAAAAGMIANGLFAAFYVSFAVQHFSEPHGVAAVLGSAADYAGIPQNVLLGVVTGVVYRFLSPRQRLDRVLRITGAVAYAVATVAGVLTVTGLLPGGADPVAIGAVLVSTVWLLAIGIRGARLPDPRRARMARIGRLIAATMLSCGALVLFGFGINVAAIVWASVVVGALTWLAIPVWVLGVGRVLPRSRDGLPATGTAVSAATWPSPHHHVGTEQS